jgi:uncharacterized protein YjbI with pentapeptide repeats
MGQKGGTTVASKFGTWWQKIKQYRVAIAVIGIALAIIVALIIMGYRLDWTGFGGYHKVTTTSTISGTSTRTEEYQPGKALWDWLQLLIIPWVLAVGALLFNLATTRTEQKIASNKQREDLLQAYLDRMSDLLLKEHLRSSAVDAEVRNVAHVRTITILFQLDARRIGYVFAFLREAGLMSTTSNDNVVSLSQADFGTVNWSKADLSKARLSGADLSKADLSKADLSKAIIVEADLSKATLSEADLSRADLSRADLSGQDLSNKDLSGATLSGAYLNEATLSGAILKGAIGIPIEELEKQARSLQGATLPDGSKHPK